MIMILNKKSAKRLNRPMTIDLNRIILESKGYIYAPKKKYDFIFTYFFIFWVIAFIFFILVGYTSFNKTNAQWPVNVTNYYIKWIPTKLPAFLYDNIKIECKNAKNKHHCIKTSLSISYAESTWWIPTNYFGINAKDNDIHGFVSRYNRLWYKSKEWSFFYGSDWKAWKSHYCLTEKSSWSVGDCPNWRKNFNYIFFNKELDIFIKKYMI